MISELNKLNLSRMSPIEKPTMLEIKAHTYKNFSLISVDGLVTTIMPALNAIIAIIVNAEANNGLRKK